MSETTSHDAPSAEKTPHAKQTAAGRLLALIAKGEAFDFARVARCLVVPERYLRECRDGLRRLEPEVQVLLAALVMELAPEHAHAARRLHAQAQTELRLRQGVVGLHQTYDSPRWR